MFTNQVAYIGVDPTSGQRPFTFAVLDGDLRLLALRQGDMGEVLAFIGGQQQVWVAVCAPARPNQRVMENPAVRQSLSPVPRPGRWSDFRLAEYLLRQHHIFCPRTAADVQSCPAWMQRGFLFYSSLEKLGLRPYPEESPMRYLEVYPHASFCALLGQVPFPKGTLEGRLQRQLALYEQRLLIHDPMEFFEEITRRRLLQGILPGNLYSPAELDALVAALTAWLVDRHPEQTMLLGDPVEGQIVMPVSELRKKY